MLHPSDQPRSVEIRATGYEPETATIEAGRTKPLDVVLRRAARAETPPATPPVEEQTPIEETSEEDVSDEIEDPR